jgi:Flp pilus assembly protein TadD
MNKATLSIVLSTSILLTALLPALAANTAKAGISQKAKLAAKANVAAKTNVAAKANLAAKTNVGISREVAAQANKLFSQGIDFADKKFYNEAIVKFQQAVTKDPTKAGYYNELAVSLLARNQNDDQDQAIIALRKAAELAPKHVAYWVNLGSALNRSHDLSGAEEAYRKALALNPKDWQAHENLAVALYAQKKMTEARDEFNAAIANNPPAIYKEIAEKAIQDIDGFIARRDQETAAAKDGDAPSAAAIDAAAGADLHVVLPAEKKDASGPSAEQSSAPAPSAPEQTGSGNPDPANPVPPGL